MLGFLLSILQTGFLKLEEDNSPLEGSKDPTLHNCLLPALAVHAACIYTSQQDTESIGMVISRPGPLWVPQEGGWFQHIQKDLLWDTREKTRWDEEKPPLRPSSHRPQGEKVKGAGGHLSRCFSIAIKQIGSAQHMRSVFTDSQPQRQKVKLKSFKPFTQSPRAKLRPHSSLALHLRKTVPLMKSPGCCYFLPSTSFAYWFPMSMSLGV